MKKTLLITLTYLLLVGCGYKVINKSEKTNFTVEEIIFTDLSIKTALQSYESCFEQGFDGIPGFEGSLKIPDAPGF